MRKIVFFLIAITLIASAFVFLGGDNSVIGQSSNCTDPKPAVGNECYGNNSIRYCNYFCIFGDGDGDGDSEWYWVKICQPAQSCNPSGTVCPKICSGDNGSAGCVADTNGPGAENCHFGCSATTANAAECAWKPGPPDPNDPLRCTAETFGENSPECFRLGCNQNTCEMVPKTNLGAFICSINRDCQYLKCQSLACVLAAKTSGGQNDECSAESSDSIDCKHLACNNNRQCVYAVGAGPDQCNNGNDPNLPFCQRIICDPNRSSSCVKRDIAGQDNLNCVVNDPNGTLANCAVLSNADGSATPGDQLQPDIDRCINTNPDNTCRHQGCQISDPYQCVWKPGEGGPECGNDNDCKHLVCNNNRQCVWTGGVGQNECNTADNPFCQRIICDPNRSSSCVK
ncbi:MAG: hypothetical protein AAB509_00815, partial [Patescibacteria group bacterium]